MISIIISSFRDSYFSALALNIADTVGVEFEIVKVYNPGIMGICEAYNSGASNSKYPYLCFVHEDVQFVTRNWGQKLIQHFTSDANTGVIGVAGSICKSKMLTSWWQPVISGIETKRTNYLQYYQDNKITSHMYLNPLKELKSKVVSLDGVFLACPQKVWREILFDQNLLKGFHGYDLDFSLRAGNQFNNYVVYDILLEHFSEGVNDLKWLKQNFLVHKKNKNILPTSKNHQISLSEIKKFDKIYLVQILKIFGSEYYNKLDLLVIFIQLIINSRLYKPNLRTLKLFFNLLLVR